MHAILSVANLQVIVSTGGFMKEFKYLESSNIWEQLYQSKILFRKKLRAD
jgi:hypothetical protein